MKHFLLHTSSLILLSLLAACTQSSNTVDSDKPPRIWVLTDMSDPNDRRAGGHPYNDPDDIVSLAALLLEANRFDIERIVYSSNQRDGLSDATSFVNEVFVSAYEHDQPYLNEAFPGYPKTIPFELSSVQQNGSPIPYNPDSDYSDLGNLPTVKDLVAAAEAGPLYVLIWGPATEAAMAVKHCLTTGKIDALENMTMVAHWTKSLIAQGTPERPFHVANCRDDKIACHYLHEEALSNPLVKYVELGSTGQKGVVNGSDKYSKIDDFSNSRLGQIFRHAKFYHGKPDQSDGATFWLLVNEFGPTIAEVAKDGTMDQATEEKMRDQFLADAPALMDDLLARSNAAAKATNPFSPEFIANEFTYVYQFLNGKFYIYTPLPAEYTITNTAGEIVLSGTADGNIELDFSDLPNGTYPVTVTLGGTTRDFELEK